MLLPQDLYILLKICCINEGWTFRLVADQLYLSISQVHSGLKRAEIAGLFSSTQRRPMRPALEEFIVHGVRYAYAVRPGAPARGVPTSYAAPPLNELIVQSSGPVPVWPYPHGEVRGYIIEPLHPAAPKAAIADTQLYELLALVDGIREGRARERKLAEKELHQRLRQ
jgi:hypothetical protein